jgi:DNA-directed RNA polymerase subunit K
MQKEGFTKYEVARILGARALQLSMNAPVLLVIPKEKLEDINYDPLKIAELEFEAGVLPITVKRPLPERTEVEEDTEEEAEILKEMPLEEAAPEKKADDEAEEKAPEEAPATTAE